MIDFKSTTDGDLFARWQYVRKATIFLCAAWNNQNLMAQDCYNDEIDEPGYLSALAAFSMIPGNKELREFIHNLCTNLCAELNLIEGELLIRAGL